jgi:hypothetical protein
MPQNCVQPDNAINITEGTSSESLGIKSSEYTHCHGTLHNFFNTTHVKMIIPMREDPTRPMHSIIGILL